MRAPPTLYGGFAARLAFLVARALPLRLRDRLLPRVGARPAALGRAAPGACGAARHLVRSRQSSRLGVRARALVGAAGAHRAGDVPERAPDRLVPDRARPHRPDHRRCRSRASRCGSCCVVVALPFFGVGSAFYICAVDGRRPSRLADARHLAASRDSHRRRPDGARARRASRSASRSGARPGSARSSSRSGSAPRSRPPSGCSAARRWRAPK